MHKKIAAELTSLAHDILQIKNKQDVFALKRKARKVYEKLTVLAHIEEYIDTTSSLECTKEELFELVKNVEKNGERETVTEKLPSEESPLRISTKKRGSETPSQKEYDSKNIIQPNKETFLVKDASNSSFDSVDTLEKRNLPPKLSKKPTDKEKVVQRETLPTLEEELKDVIALDVVADLFENAHKKSLNDTFQRTLQVGLNDRIAFVKNLFDESQEDFNRVMNQLDTFETEKEAKNFIKQFVKPDYNWTKKEEIEERFMALIKRKFL